MIISQCVLYYKLTTDMAQFQFPSRDLLNMAYRSFVVLCQPNTGLEALKYSKTVPLIQQST